MRESIKLTEQDWQALDRVARSTRSVFRGRASWRILLRRIAKGELQVYQHQPTKTQVV